MDPAACAALTMQHIPDAKFARDAMAAFPYRQLIGSLMYLMAATRPDLAFALSKFSKFNNSPGRAHWEAACKVLGYLRQRADVGLLYTREAPLQRGLRRSVCMSHRRPQVSHRLCVPDGWCGYLLEVVHHLHGGALDSGVGVRGGK